MAAQCAFQQTFNFFGSKPIVVEPLEDELTSDAGLLPIREFDEAIGLTQQFGDALFGDDHRDPNDITHSFLEMARARIFGILAGYEDQNDHDVLRSDPIFKLIVDRSPDDEDLASQPTLSRFENAITVPTFSLLQDLFLDQFIASFDEPPGRLTFDIDTFDDPAHGAQQLVLFHAFYKQHQYQPRLITCADNDQIVMLCLLHGSAHAALGADDDLAYLCRRLREVWPDVDIELRADSGFHTPHMFDACERLDVWFSIGLKMNPVLSRASETRLAEAQAAFDETGQPQRMFVDFWYRAGSWEEARHVIVKCEVNAQGTNRRAVLTNRHGASTLPAGVYDEYADRGESENRNKEFKCGLFGDRLSDHRYFANLFRLYLHSAAHNLLVRLRHTIACPPEPEGPDDGVPVEAFRGQRRKRYERLRRKADPLGEGHPDTWRTRLIKVAALVRVSTRRIHVSLSACWPFLDFYRAVSEAIREQFPPLLSPD